MSWLNKLKVAQGLLVNKFSLDKIPSKKISKSWGVKTDPPGPLYSSSFSS